ncbi:MAG: hypothetical protein SOI13_01355 [Bifidobacterium mongoliense]|jgi:uncharacterized C2H2 Zn-finger protein|uniref:hypothetical protein n=1 Tax=Bifidobacterium mongoliense TaxID=518643 RepID=UPI002F359099
MSDIDTEYTDEITCPYCGHVFASSFEYGPERSLDAEFPVNCEHCDRLFVVNREFEVTYSTSKPTATRHTIGGGEQAKCYVCGKTGGTKMVSDVCDHLVCQDCEEKHAVCCDDYRQVLEQTKQDPSEHHAEVTA